MYYVYVLQSLVNFRYYVGQTNDLERRLLEHNSGFSKYTSFTRPFKLVYFEKYETLTEARKREKQIKSYKGGRAFKNLINVV